MILAPRISTLLLAALLAACTPESTVVVVPFEVRYDGRALECSDDSTALTDFRMYLHDVRVGGHPVIFADDEFWQSDNTALLDLENGIGSCNTGTPRVNSSITIQVPENAGQGLKFVVGVPESANHGNPITAIPPLGFTDMHWHWKSGYKFLRAGVRTESGSFWMHLGSSRCKGTISDLKGCDNANRPYADLPGFVAGRDKVVVDIGRLLSGSVPAAGGADCSSGPTEETCRAPFRELNISFEHGDATGPASVFHSEAIQ